MEIDALNSLRAAPALEPLTAALGDTPAYLVGGAVRDALLGHPVDELDIAIEGGLEPVLARLEVEARIHERFGTAVVVLGWTTVDLARTRRERYAHPGALPEVEPAPIRSDLARRDFTINAIALPITGPLELIDPHRGVADLADGLLRVLHDESLRDDPTRALRAARYAARFGFALEPATERLIRAADLSTVSAERVEAELVRIGAECDPLAAFELLADWGLIGLDSERRRWLAAAAELAGSEPWSQLVSRPRLLAAIVAGGGERLEAARRLAALAPSSPSAGFEAARGHDDQTLALARAIGGEWIDRHVTEWRRIELTIDGDALIAAGIPEGPAVGRGLAAALRGRLDGTVEAGREPELAAALRAAAERD